MENPRLPEFDENSPLRPSRFGHLVLRVDRLPPVCLLVDNFFNNFFINYFFFNAKL